jgi:hypothetical protein
MEMKNNTEFKKHIYWVPGEEFVNFKNEIKSTDFKIKPVYKTSCETLNAKNKTLRYASPRIFNGLCSRQGSWYRESNKAGNYLVVSEEQLPEKYNQYMDASIKESDFTPESLPTTGEIKKLLKSDEYQSQKPVQWEKKGLKDTILFKIMFTLTGFWGFGDNIKTQWNNQRSNHANFLARQYTAKIDDEEVPYSVTENDGVCSSCVEFFNVIEQDSRKMVRACPGSITFTGVKRKKYYDVQPVVFTPTIGAV